MSATVPVTTDKTDNMETIGRWKISKLIRKGRNTYIHEGIDIKNDKIVALKFISKADKTWVKQQAKQIETEIQALQKIRHKHVIKLYAYNLDAKYPLRLTQKNGSNKSKCKDGYISAVLLVLEYASCGELFNLLYYTSGLNENISRTYFKQIICGIDICHNKGIIHRDLRPKNILLNNNYYVKITNFNTSKIIKSDSDFLMKTKFIGPRSYQSPELLTNKSLYDFKCDIFSIGVILFILMAGYPPFEEATKTDRWYRPIIQKKYDKFWKHHKNANITDLAKDLLNKMLAFDPKERATMSDIKKHRWFNGVTLGRFTLQMAIQERYRQSEKIRRQKMRQSGSAGSGDPKKTQRNNSEVTQAIDLSQLPNLDEIGVGKPYRIHLYPASKNEYFEGGVYTFGWDNTRPIYDYIAAVIEQANGAAEYNEMENTLNCTMNVGKKGNNNGNQQNIGTEISFIVSIYESRLWKNKYIESELVDSDVIKQSQEDIIYIVCIARNEGDELLYRKIKNTFVLERCSSIFKGLPQWARSINKLNNINASKEELLVSGYLRKRFKYFDDDYYDDYHYLHDDPLPLIKRLNNIRYLMCDFYGFGHDDNETQKDDENDDYDDELLDFKW